MYAVFVRPAFALIEDGDEESMRCKDDDKWELNSMDGRSEEYLQVLLRDRMDRHQTSDYS
jgi:hypothetical protein